MLGERPANDRLVLEGDSVSSASSLYLEREIDLAARPVLEWSWRIAGTPAVAAAQEVRAG